MKRRKNRSWLQYRGYPHFGSKLTAKQRPFIVSYVKSTSNIAAHRFFPLIHKTIASRGYKRKKDFATDKETKCFSYINEDGKRVLSTKARKIYYANHLDSMVYSYYANEVLGKLYEAHLRKYPAIAKSVIAYRTVKKIRGGSGKCNIDFAHEVFCEIDSQLIARKQCVAIAFDISSFFDNLDHRILKTAWLALLKEESGLQVDELPSDHYSIFKSLTKCSFVHYKDVLKELGYNHKNELRRKEPEHIVKNYSEFRARFTKKGKIKKHPFTKEVNGKAVRKGIPQGTPISAFLSNLYLLEFDKKICEHVKEMGGLYRRYSDDLVIVCDQKFGAQLADYVRNLICDSFALDIQKSKTQQSLFEVNPDGKVYCTSYEEDKVKPFQYLGFEYDGMNARIRPASISKFYRSLKRMICIRGRCAYKATRYKFNKQGKYPGKINRGLIYQRFSHLGKSGKTKNYLHYTKKVMDLMPPEPIKRQLKNSWRIINIELRKAESRI